MTDEIHQLFVPGRDGNIIDVGIDTLGAMIGTIPLVLYSMRKMWEKGKRKVDPAS